MNIQIRPALESEIDILHEFEKGIIQTERPFDPTLKNGEIHYYDLLALIRSEQSEVLVAVSDNELIGSGYVKIVAAEPYQKFTEFGYLGFMYVKPVYRGKGINKMILTKLTDWAKIKGLTELRLEVYDENTIAKTAYGRSGFIPGLLTMRMEI